MLTHLALVLLLQQDPDAVTRCAECKPLNEPPCSYVITQHQKGLVKDSDPVVAWIRARHNGGAAPLRHFLAGPRVVNDTYGLFFYDPDGGYVAAYEKAYGYEFHGWRRGVMVVKHEDGTLFSALTGFGIDGPRQGQSLSRIANVATTWAHWLALHPESTAYDLFDGTRYPVVELPTQPNAASVASRSAVDARMPADAVVLGVAFGGQFLAFPLGDMQARAVMHDKVGDANVVVFVNEAGRGATAFRAMKNETKLDFYVDDIAPLTAPFKDKNTGTRWSLAGRGIDGLLRGEELTWVDSIQCRWFGWVAEHPQTLVHQPTASAPADGAKKQ